MRIDVKNVTKAFKQITILENINMTFESGKIYGLIGRNGSGKSVFLKMLCGFYSPTNGEILFDNINCIKQQIFPLNTRALIEKPDFISDLSGYENLELLAKIQNKIGKDEIIEALKKVNLLEDMDKKFSKYSLGMKQKLGIAQVLMENPEVMILDEPFNGIEDDTVDFLRDLLIKEKKNGKIIILATHIKDDVLKIVDELYKFDKKNVTKLENFK
ncbi:MAG: ABC transporter ATP-binding protein [Bacilli bacterium]|nr:ABC transporter ATP-binding protein [Bacilli bacterium]